MESVPMWCVYVAEPMRPRRRKQTLLMYRVGALTREEAIEAVRKRVLEDAHTGWDLGGRIVGCYLKGDSSSVVFDGSVTRTPESVAEMPSL